MLVFAKLLEMKYLFLFLGLSPILAEFDFSGCMINRWACDDGTCIEGRLKCNGAPDCPDASDETLRHCKDHHRCYSSFRCAYGACVARDVVCDGVNNCIDGSDELLPRCRNVTARAMESFWYCDDGTRIDTRRTCNGAINCPDRSDETLLLCWNNDCPEGFRCVYGGCVSKTATCDGIRDCADSSDEMQHKCRNETTTAECLLKLTQDRDFDHWDARYEECERKDTACSNNQLLTYPQKKCDGRVDCQDGSDEGLQTCATDVHNCTARGRFRCQDGGCVWASHLCDGHRQCADGSDELPGLCSENSRYICVLPDLPKYGNYTVPKLPDASPGQSVQEALLVYSCFPGYILQGRSHYAYCKQGRWFDKLPKCLSQCPITKHPSITYLCLPRGPLVSLEVEQECGDLVPDGATVRPECRAPVYQTTGVLPYMHCLDGLWDRPLPTCDTECGLETAQGSALVLSGESAKRGELPWHAAIYTKRKRPYLLICSGTVISNSVILTAAHCFWDDVAKILPAANYAVAVGKLYRPWNDPHEVGLQRSDILSIKTPVRFLAGATNYQDDIALVLLATPVLFHNHVRPVCMDFSRELEERQLIEGNKGKVAGWGFTSPDGNIAMVLKVAELPYIPVSRCINESDFLFQGLITSDKICAGARNGPSLCKGDSGGGLVFPHESRYYLRGVVSTAPRSLYTEDTCTPGFTAFTLLSKHKDFIQEHLR